MDGTSTVQVEAAETTYAHQGTPAEREQVQTTEDRSTQFSY